MATLGYARVSATDQNLDVQIAELKEVGCDKVYFEKISGANAANRTELQRLLKRLTVGDVLVVTRLDRLARSTRDLLNIIDDLGTRGIAFKALKDSWCDTSTSHGRLMLTVISGIAQFERELIKARTEEGRKRAIARGVKFGRPSKLTHFQRQELLERLSHGEMQADVARNYNITQAGVSLMANGR